MSSSDAVAWVRAAVVCACLLMAAAGSPAAGQDRSAPDDDAALRAFVAGLSRYAALRTTLEESLPSFDDSGRDPRTLMLMRRYLASAIRVARHDARQGCIFGPAAGMLRETIAHAINDGHIEGLVGEEDVRARPFGLDLALNQPVASWAMSPVPAAVLEQLPPLPAGIEYQLADGALILWDSHAEILVDVLPEALMVR
jgi:hypothetical protein